MGELLFSYILNDLELPFDVSHKNDLVYLQLIDLKWFMLLLIMVTFHTTKYE